MQAAEIVRSFINEACTLNPADSAALADLVGSVRSWSIARGLRAPARFEIVEALESLGFRVGRRADRLHAIGLSLKRPPLQVDASGKITRATI